MDYRLLVRLAKTLQLIRQFEQTGQVTIPLSDWIRFFEALTFITRDGAQKEISCAIAGEYLLFSKTPSKRDEKRQP